MAKVKIIYRGKVLKRSLLHPSVVIEREEYIGFTYEKELVRYNTGSIILHGQVTLIEKPVDTKLWHRAET